MYKKKIKIFHTHDIICRGRLCSLLRGGDTHVVHKKYTRSTEVKHLGEGCESVKV